MRCSYSPDQIRFELGRDLATDGLIVEWVTERDVERARYINEYDELEEVNDDEYAVQLREDAYAHRESFAARYPSNGFRYVSNLQRDDRFTYWYELGLTDAGERARQCYLRKQCCDETGTLDKEATLGYWFARIEKMMISAPRECETIMSDLVQWITEPWAKGLYKALNLRAQCIWAKRDGSPDYDETIRRWTGIVTFTDLTKIADNIDQMNVEWLDEEWATPLRLLRQHSRQLILCHADGTADHERTVEYWSTRKDTALLVVHRSTLFRLDDSWAQPIHDAVMEAIMKADNVALV